MSDTTKRRAKQTRCDRMMRGGRARDTRALRPRTVVEIETALGVVAGSTGLDDRNLRRARQTGSGFIISAPTIRA